MRAASLALPFARPLALPLTRLARRLVIVPALCLGLLTACGGGGATGGAAAPAAAAAGAVGNPVGVWQISYQDPQLGQSRVELVLLADGSFSKILDAQFAPSTRIYGTWRVIGNILRLDTMGGDPAQFCGPLGCSPITYPAETYAYSMPNANTLVVSDPNCNAQVTACAQPALTRIG